MGTYRVRVYQPGKSDFAGSFEVQSYQLEPIDLSFDLKKTIYYRGETVEADVSPGISTVRRWPAGRSRSRSRSARCAGDDRRGGQVPRELPDGGLRRGASLRLVGAIAAG